MTRSLALIAALALGAALLLGCGGGDEPEPGAPGVDAEAPADPAGPAPGAEAPGTPADGLTVLSDTGDSPEGVDREVSLATFREQAIEACRRHRQGGRAPGAELASSVGATPSGSDRAPRSWTARMEDALERADRSLDSVRRLPPPDRRRDRVQAYMDAADSELAAARAVAAAFDRGDRGAVARSVSDFRDARSSVRAAANAAGIGPCAA